MERLLISNENIEMKIILNKITTITDEITQGIPIFKLILRITGRSTNEIIIENTTGRITDDNHLQRKPQRTIAKKRSI